MGLQWNHNSFSDEYDLPSVGYTAAYRLRHKMQVLNKKSYLPVVCQHFITQTSSSKTTLLKVNSKNRCFTFTSNLNINKTNYTILHSKKSGLELFLQHLDVCK